MKSKSALAALSLLAVSAPAAFADKKSEAYVQTNANAVLAVLNDKSLNNDQRELKFGQYMNQFANMQSIARRVIGGNAQSLSEADFQRYYKVFEAYALEVYQVHFDEFRGEALRVLSSTDDSPQRSTVTSVIRSAKTGKETKVFWDVLASKDGQSYRIRDVGIELKPNQVLWLAQEQAAQFTNYLNNNNGNIDKLIGRINVLMADMEARKKDGRGSAYKG